MIWTLVTAGILVAGIICIIVGYNLGYDGEAIFGIGLALTILFGIILPTMIASIIGINISADIDYQNALYEREMLEYRVEHMSENITGNEMLYNDIVEFNNNLRTIKKWANSSWTNWFYNQKIASMDYIGLESN